MVGFPLFMHKTLHYMQMYVYTIMSEPTHNGSLNQPVPTLALLSTGVSGTWGPVSFLFASHQGQSSEIHTLNTQKYELPP